jgi:hypothetical protein
MRPQMVLHHSLQCFDSQTKRVAFPWRVRGNHARFWWRW